MLVSSEESSIQLCCKLKWVLLLIWAETLYYPFLLKVPKTNSASQDYRNPHTWILKLRFLGTLCNRKKIHLRKLGLLHLLLENTLV